MNNFFKRLITGLIFLFIFGATFFLSKFLFSILIFFILVTSLFEWFRFNLNFKFYFLTPIYPVLPFLLIIYLNLIDKFRLLLAVMFSLVFIFDSGCYIVGSLLGKNKICPISPGKTWEGLMGGFIFTASSLILTEKVLGKSWGWPFIILFSFALGLLALVGDFFESWLKRKAGLKDSGYFLPGHGGFLDRFDSSLFVIFLFFFLRNYLIKVF